MSDRHGPQGPTGRSDPSRSSPPPGSRPRGGDRVEPRDEGQDETGVPPEGGDPQAERPGVTRQDDDPQAGGTGAPRQGEGRSARQPGVTLAPQQLTHRHAEPPGPPSRSGIFVELPALRAHVGDILRAYLGGYQVDAWGNITFTFEGARVFVTIGMSPVGTQVGVFSITNLDVELSPSLAQFLLTTNHELGFGAFSYDADNHAVWLRHALLGTTLDAPELQTVVAAVASTAAHFDHVIASRFGGRTFDEAPPEVQDATHPPAPDPSGYL